MALWATAIATVGWLRSRPGLVCKKFCKIFQIPRHIESLDICMKH
jgi:hypothetical protein